MYGHGQPLQVGVHIGGPVQNKVFLPLEVGRRVIIDIFQEAFIIGDLPVSHRKQKGVIPLAVVKRRRESVRVLGIAQVFLSRVPQVVSAECSVVFFNAVFLEEFVGPYRVLPDSYIFAVARVKGAAALIVRKHVYPARCLFQGTGVKLPA